jgi:hypothetical protein
MLIVQIHITSFGRLLAPGPEWANERTNHSPTRSIPFSDLRSVCHHRLHIPLPFQPQLPLRLTRSTKIIAHPLNPLIQSTPTTN